MNIPRSNAAAWGQAGRDAGKTYSQIANTTRKYSPKYGDLAKLGIETRSSTKQAGIKAELAVRKAEVGAEALLDKTRINLDRDEAIRDSKKTIRKAGMVSAAGQLIGLGLQKDTELPPVTKATDFSALENFYAKQTERDNKREAEIRARMTETSETPTKTTDTTVTSSPVASSNPSKLEGNRKIVADAIAGPESGSWGYEAFNQGGAAKDMTLGEIFHKQNTKQRGLSLDEHYKSGGLHAVGRYQFIGDTLQDEVKRMG